MEMTTYTGGKFLRCGYTTGSCAAGAAKAAAIRLLSGKNPQKVQLMTPKGILLTLDVMDMHFDDDCVSCAIQKDSGDDPDITNGMKICASVKKCETGIMIDGGKGVGRVTKPGLDQAVGEAAINATPRMMIENEVKAVAEEYSYTGGISVVISIPGGEIAAARTFNPRLGIAGGLSVIGTTGIVEPMSRKALTDTIKIELNQLRVTKIRDVLFTPGNYGENFAEHMLKLSLEHHVSCSNFIGESLDMAVEEGFKNILLIGHIGKLVKLGIGVTNTHSSFGDGRMETLISCALKAGAGLELLRKISDCVSTDAALMHIYEAGLLIPAMRILGEKIGNTIARRIPDGVTAGFICYTNAEPFAGVLTESQNAGELRRLFIKTAI